MKCILPFPIRMSLRMVVLLILSIVLISCAMNTTSRDLTPRSVAVAKNRSWLSGSVSVQTAVNLHDSGQYQVRVSNWLDNGKFRVAVEETLAENGLVSPVSGGDPDYVLDVWVEKIRSDLQIFGKGFMIDMTSIWRLTRVKDGKVLVCEFVDGHGASHAVGTSAHAQSTVAATQETISNGLAMLSDDSLPHMSAIPASIRPSMGTVVPENLQILRRGWSELQVGLTIDEVNRLIDPSMVIVNAAKTHKIRTGTLSSTKFQSSKDSFRLEGEDASDFLTIKTTSLPGATTTELITDVYKLVFVNGGLKRWELRQ